MCRSTRIPQCSPSSVQFSAACIKLGRKCARVRCRKNGFYQLNACSGSLLMTLVKPQLAEPGQLRLSCICSLLADVRRGREELVICLITHLSLKGYRQVGNFVMGCSLLLLYLHSLADHLFCTEYVVHW